MSFSVIIPSRNAANLVPCVEAVRKHEPEARIIVVDDGVDWVTCHSIDMRLTDSVIPGEKPFIFSRNVNKGIRYALDAPYSPRFGDDILDSAIVILNDDALLQTPGGFSLLARTAEEHPEYGLIASTCNNVGNRNQWPARDRWPAQIEVDFLRDEPRMVCFVAVLIPRHTIETVGLLDERYVGYGVEDDDFSFSVRKAGLKIGIHDGCYVDHGSLTSSFRGPAGAGGNFIPNLMLFIQKWGVDNWNQPKETSQFRGLFP